ncbi:hypothetical protein PIB30_081478 [Stylosanthes scabra]|uniref:Fe2OG dioxygenase domain-containing protein n=1 Tax=Stylosanthes scabra TaxID=79078 RepID=A0ABU6YQN2_9FABA|nr:hypothetical protein [Stylosanthes scabra]
MIQHPIRLWFCLLHRETIEAYTEGIHELAASVLQKMAESLGVVGIDFKDWPFTFRSIKYSFNPENIGSAGVPIHTDIGCLTLLQDDEKVGGLEMMDHSGSFKEVPLQSGSFFCLIGDVGHVWSNGRFHNVKHRVLCKVPASRYSIGVFMLSPRDGKVEAPMELVDPPNHPRLYRPINYEEMRVFRVSTGQRASEFLQQFRNLQ